MYFKFSLQKKNRIHDTDGKHSNMDVFSTDTLDPAITIMHNVKNKYTTMSFVIREFFTKS